MNAKSGRLPDQLTREQEAIVQGILDELQKDVERAVRRARKRLWRSDIGYSLEATAEQVRRRGE